MKMKKITKLSLLIVFLVSTTISCKKNINSGQLRVDMTDSPSNGYEHIYIDLKQVSVHYDGSREDTWMNLPTNKGSYDLLELTNNLTVVIVPECDVPIGKISQIRFILGEQNSVVIDGISYFLKIPSSYTSGIKIKVNQVIKRRKNLLIVLDFNAEKSVKQIGTGNYIMEPVIEVKSVSNY
jgi:hypothetical protein